MAALKEALAAQKEAREAIEGPSEKGGSESAHESAPAGERPDARAAMEEALANLEKAESAGEKALAALRQHDADAAIAAQSEASLARKAAAKAHAANAMEATERSARAAFEAATQAKGLPKSDWHWNNAAERQATALKDVREAVDALKAKLGEQPDQQRARRRAEAAADRIRAAQDAAEWVERKAADAISRNDRAWSNMHQRDAERLTDKARGLIEAQRDRAVRQGENAAAEALGKALDAQDKAIAAQRTAEAARKKADASNKNEDRTAAFEAQQAAAAAQHEASDEMARASQAMEGAPETQTEDAQSGGASSNAAQEPGETADEASSETQTDAPASGGSPAKPAHEAADEISSAAAAQAAKLGIDENARREKGGDAEEQKSQGGGSSRGEKTEDGGSGGGGLDKELEDLAKELKRNDIPEDQKGRIARKAWFRIRGAVKEGLGERDLRNIPAEYRELVRRYFLRLVEEKP